MGEPIAEWKGALFISPSIKQSWGSETASVITKKPTQPNSINMIAFRTAAILLLVASVSARPSEHWEPEGHSHSEHTRPYDVTVVKKIGVPIPHPVAVSVPQYVKIPIPHPYPVHVTVEQPIHVPVYKVVPQVVEKPVPYTVEKPVPYEVEKPYPVEVEKKVEVPIPKPYPVHVPVYKHIYHHKGGKH
ncbi:unnamed protein product [Euphydryas editha]|uniref:Uncharacterized protein n=1 Tax=Euphydryas editha TaxID=104508 RepID=A0AAU9U5N7_EUPED|nr:unnamed protein product [Euphydryas editha]